MITYSSGDVILIPFPFTDFSTLKQRPAAVISSSAFNASHSDIIVLAITSQIPQTIPQEDYLLSKEDIEMAGLPKPSLIKAGKITSISKMLIRKKLGSLSGPTLDKVKAKLHTII